MSARTRQRIFRRCGAIASAAGTLILGCCLLPRSPVLASGALPNATLLRGGTMATSSPLPDPLGLLAPPQPDAPAGPAGACRFPRLGSGEIRRIYSLPVPGVLGGTVSVHGAVDPRRACVTFHLLDDHIDRGVNGAGFTAVFRNATAPAWRPSAPMALSAPVFAGGALYVYDTTGNGGIFESLDDGGHWAERDQGLPLGPAIPHLWPSSQPLSPTTITTLVFARSQPATGYALVAVAGGTTLLFRTGDGGASWQLRAVPDPSLGAVAIDPFDADHLVAARDDGTSDQQLWSYYVSADGGQTWTPELGPGAGTGILGIALHSGASQDGQLIVDVLVRSSAGGGAAELWSQPLGTAQWTRRASGDISVMESSVSDPTRLILVAGATVTGANPPASNRLLAVLSSTTDFTTYTERALPMLTSDARVRNLETDAAGDVVVDVTAADPVSSWTEVEDLFILPSTAFTPTGPGVLTSLPQTTSLLPTRVPGSGGLPVAPALRTCPLDNLTVQGKTFPFSYATITFDGRYIDYTDNPQNVIFRLDPRTCRSVAPITISVTDTGDTAQVFRALTYDPDYVFDDGASGAILVATDINSHDPRVPDGRYVPVYAVSPLSPHRVELATAIITDGRSAGDGQGLHPFVDPTAFAYDVSRHALWVDHGDLRRLPQHKGAPAEEHLDNCMNYGGTSAAGWTSGSGGVMYMEDESDALVYRVDTMTCIVISGFGHARVIESYAEVDQMACDNATFAGQRPGGSVLWIRDAGGTVAAYAIPLGDCPDVGAAKPPPATVVAPHPVVPRFAGILALLDPPIPVPEYVPQPLPASSVAPAQSMAEAQVQAQSSSQAQLGILPQRQRQAQAARQRARNAETQPVAVGQPQPLLAVRTAALQRTAGIGAALAIAMAMVTAARRRAPAVAPVRERRQRRRRRLSH